MASKRNHRKRTQKKRNLKRKGLKDKSLKGKSLKGGFLGLFENNSDPYAPKKSWSDRFNNLTSSAKSYFSGLFGSNQTQPINYESSINYEPLPQQQEPIQQQQEPIQQQQEPIQQTNYEPLQQQAGKKSRKHKYRKQKGGDSNLAYYAQPVSNIKVAEPTYWIKGGTRRYRKH